MFVCLPATPRLEKINVLEINQKVKDLNLNFFEAVQEVGVASRYYKKYFFYVFPKNTFPGLAWNNISKMFKNQKKNIYLISAPRKFRPGSFASQDFKARENSISLPSSRLAEQLSDTEHSSSMYASPGSGW